VQLSGKRRVIAASPLERRVSSGASLFFTMTGLSHTVTLEARLFTPGDCRSTV
jgi:hypothetical protein